MARPFTDPEDAGRRRLLEESDRLLAAVEELRLTDRSHVPDSLGRAISELQVRLGRKDPPLPPATIRSAHALVFAVQSRLMSANPRNPLGRSHPGRAHGAPRVQALRQGATWKMLTLPAPTAGGPDPGWLELVEATVERALERWAYAQHQAAQAARAGSRARRELAMARAAWDNYYELRCEAERISRAAPGQLRAGPAAR